MAGNKGYNRAVLEHARVLAEHGVLRGLLQYRENVKVSVQADGSETYLHAPGKPALAHATESYRALYDRWELAKTAAEESLSEPPTFEEFKRAERKTREAAVRSKKVKPCRFLTRGYRNAEAGSLDDLY